MLVQDLTVSTDLDRSALADVLGGGTVYQYLGSSISSSNWAYAGTSYSFLGYACIGGRIKRKYRKVRNFRRTQVLRHYWNMFVG